MTQVSNLTCEYRSEPLGIDLITPRLSWQLQSDRIGARQTAYRILAASKAKLLKPGQADLWDSGRVASDQSIQATYGGKKLKSRQRVHWKVIVWDEEGKPATSAPTWFELGMLKRSDWKAKWIGAALTGGPRASIPAPYLRKTFRLPAKAKTARLYITALGLYECSINGKFVSETILNPGWTDFHKRVRYQVYDVSRLLRSGDNVINAILGDGWAVGHLGMENRQHYVDQPRLFSQLEVTFSNGRSRSIITDGSWKLQFGPILDNDTIMGEAYDARLEMPGWDKAKFNDKGWQPAIIYKDPSSALVAMNGPSMCRHEALRAITDPVNKSSLRIAQYIFDMGQNMVGWIRFKGRAPAGTTVTLRYAEVLDADGSIYTENLRSARVTDYYTFKGKGEEVWEPKFTFHGFRYVEIIGYSGEVNRDTITGIVVHSDMNQTGSFTCSDSNLNQLQQNILWGQKGNFVDVPTDCPQRDERQGWTGDIQVFARTAAFNMDVAGFMTKWAQDVADAQSKEGMVPPIVPNAGMSGQQVDGGPAWADAVIICPWTLYLCYGDKHILEKNYGVMSKFMKWVIATSPGGIRCALEDDSWPGVGDWLAINAATPRDLIGTAYLAYDAKLMAQVAEVLGKKKDAEKYRQYFGEVKQAFANRFLKGSKLSVDHASPVKWQKRMDYVDALAHGNRKPVDHGPISSEVFNTDLFKPTQTSYVLALHFDLLPDKLRPLAVSELVADIKRRDMHLSTGFVGTSYLPHVLSQNGRLDVAYQLLFQKSWPSWLYPVTQGATTIWERWDGWTEENGFQAPRMNSFNHYAYGAIGAWLYSTVAGIEIDPASAGYKHTLLQPQPGGGLTQAGAKLCTPYGELLSEWQIKKNRFEWKIMVPPNTTATAHLPPQVGSRVKLNGKTVVERVHHLEAGEYFFVADL